MFFVCRQLACGSHYQVDWSDHGTDCVGGHQHAGRLVHWSVRTLTNNRLHIVLTYALYKCRVILQQHVSCPGLNYGGVAVVVVRWDSWCTFIVSSHVLKTSHHCSVIVLAFVKSEGRKTKSTTTLSDSPVTENTRLLGSRTSSLEGSLHDRVVSCSTAWIVGQWITSWLSSLSLNRTERRALFKEIQRRWCLIITLLPTYLHQKFSPSQKTTKMLHGWTALLSVL